MEFTFANAMFKRNFAELHASFMNITFISNARLKFAKNQAKGKQHYAPKLLLLENYLLSSFTSSSKNDRRYSKKSTKIKCVCFNEVIWLMTMKMRLKKKNTAHKYDINRPRPRHGYTKCKMSLNIMMIICIK